ncbi:hypothetical protein [Kitasatospora sp. NPDC057541]|uniref:hypothetical protein n=1 Tax=unclassified Kitasatospora TaxID=2633591 RepID=UPI00367BA299
MSPYRGPARLLGIMAALFAAGAVLWLGVVLWGQAAGWNTAGIHAAAEGGWWTGGVAAAALAIRLLLRALAEGEER